MPKWKHCRPCELWAIAQEAGPPNKSMKGFHLEWVRAVYDD